MFTVIKAEFEDMRKNYYKYDNLNKPVKTLLDGLNEGIRKENEKRAAKGEKALAKATPCCFQVSHSLNAAGVTVPEESKQRKLFKPADGNGYYIGNVRELEQILTDRYGTTADIRAGKKTREQMKTLIFGRQGILVFRDEGYGYHTELWDKHDILQTGGISGNMSEEGIFNQPRILFWEVTKAQRSPTMPDWLTGWWSVNDGEQYYYHFVGLDYAYWTKEKPTNAKELKHSSKRNNYADVAVTPKGVVVTWAARGGAQTIETFTNDGSSGMKGTSNRYGPLTAKKMF